MRSLKGCVIRYKTKGVIKVRNAVKILFGSVLCAVIACRAFAENTDIVFNRVRICIDGETKANWDQNIENTELPSSITYKDTTYVPLRFISNSMGRNVAWNGDTKIVTITNSLGERLDNNLPLEKEDLNGNVWKYDLQYAYNDTYAKFYDVYLSVTDEKRGFERFYRLVDETAYKFTDDGVYFVDSRHLLHYLPFLHDENSHEGKFFNIPISGNSAHSFCFDGDYMIWAENILASTNPHGYICIANLKNSEVSKYNLDFYKAYELNVKKSTDDEYVLEFIKGKYWLESTHEVSVNKDTLNFGEPKNILRVHKTAADYEDKLTLKNFTFITENMPIDEVYSKIGKEDRIEDEWTIYELEDDTELLLKVTDGKITEVFIKTEGGIKIPVSFLSDGSLYVFD